MLKQENKLSIITIAKEILAQKRIERLQKTRPVVWYECYVNNKEEKGRYRGCKNARF